MTVMFDSVDLPELAWAVENLYLDALAGYVTGNFVTYPHLESLVSHLTGIHLLDISPFASADATCLDVEPGDAVNAQAPAWVKRQIARGVHRPVLYTSASNVDALVAELKRAGIARRKIRIWSAHYTLTSHICGPATCGACRTACDGTQWTSRAHGRNLDQSVLLDSFFAPPKPPARKPATLPEDPVQIPPVPAGQTATATALVLGNGAVSVRFFANAGKGAPAVLRVDRRDGGEAQTLRLDYDSSRTLQASKGIYGWVIHRDDHAGCEVSAVVNYGPA